MRFEILNQMGKVNLKTGGSLALVLLWTLNARTEGYLPKSGPPALRFQTVHKFDRSLLPPLPRGDELPADPAPPSPDAGIPADSTNAVVSAASTNAVAAPDPDMVSMLPQVYGATNSGAAVLTSNDLLATTPQMFIEYFRPGEGRGNSTNFSVFMPVNFAPATPPPPPPPSSATYRVQ
jgi:hypothetical protein